MSAIDKREDWATPGGHCWAVDEQGGWKKGRIVTIGADGYLVLVEGDACGVATKLEHEIRPRDMCNFGKDKPAPMMARQDRRA